MSAPKDKTAEEAAKAATDPNPETNPDAANASEEAQKNIADSYKLPVEGVDQERDTEKEGE